MSFERIPKIGIVGCGFIAKKHREAILETEGEIVALCDVCPEHMEELATGLPSQPTQYTDYLTFLHHPGMEGVAICVPNYLHVPFACAALDLEKNVILEKPLALNAVQAQELVRHPNVAQCAVVYQRRWNRDVQAIHTYIEEHPYDPIVKVDAQIFVRRDPSYWDGWRTHHTLAGGQNLLNIDVHYFDLLQWWLGKQYTVEFAKLAYRKNLDQAVFVRLSFGGVPVTFFGSSIHDDRVIDMRVQFHSGLVMAYTKDDGSHADVYTSFFLGRHIDHGTVSAKEALTSLQIVDDIYALHERTP